MTGIARPPVLPLYEPRELFRMPVSYLPSQTDGGASTTPLNFRESPFRLLWADIKLVASLILWVPHIFLPLKTTSKFSELHPSWMNMRDLTLHIILGLLGIIFLLVAAPLGIGAPGGASGIFVLLYCGIIWVCCIPLRAKTRVLNSKVDLAGFDLRPEESWVFVNGVSAGKHWLQANIDLLSSIFKRPVVGIHNRTYGVVFDLMECLVQRCFSYSTEDTRIMYRHLKDVLLDQRITRVVCIAHSQGGIILSTALDSLFADVPSGAFDKLEIYTFGCAANHFNNPVRFVPSTLATPSSPSSSPSRTATATTTSPQYNNPSGEERLIRHIEHYANEHDFVSRFGVLYFTRDKLSNRFVGKVFENKGHGGHLMNQHYLDRMFTGESSAFLDQVVDIDEDTAVLREEAAGEQGDRDREAAEIRAGTPREKEEKVVDQGVETPGRETSSSVVGVVRGETPGSHSGGTGERDRAEECRRSLQAQRGKTVRDLSRLWRYTNGGSPKD